MTLLPADRHALDGHPLADLTVRVKADLAKIGIPMYLDSKSGDGRDTHPGGMGADLGDKHLLLCWDRPEQKRVGTAAVDPYEDDELAVIQHAAHALTAAVVSALVGFGYTVRVEGWSNPFAPMVFVS
ncbi:hypothetical protein [Kitasatospora sp. NPDC015120]|uniref:hypothetical protein n=1 Tax=Kitasatospora sp. NPDC015120 TaxID=3364023 RepID=UPI0036F47950